MRLVPLVLLLAACSSVHVSFGPEETAPPDDSDSRDRYMQAVHLDLTEDQLFRRVEQAAADLGWVKVEQAGHTLVYDVPVSDTPAFNAHDGDRIDRVTYSFERAGRGTILRIESELGSLLAPHLRDHMRQVAEGVDRIATPRTR